MVMAVTFWCQKWAKLDEWRSQGRHVVEADHLHCNLQPYTITDGDLQLLSQAETDVIWTLRKKPTATTATVTGPLPGSHYPSFPTLSSVHVTDPVPAASSVAYVPTPATAVPVLARPHLYSSPVQTHPFIANLHTPPPPRPSLASLNHQPTPPPPPQPATFLIPPTLSTTQSQARLPATTTDPEENILQQILVDEDDSFDIFCDDSPYPDMTSNLRHIARIASPVGVSTSCAAATSVSIPVSTSPTRPVTSVASVTTSPTATMSAPVVEPANISTEMRQFQILDTLTDCIKGLNKTLSTSAESINRDRDGEQTVLRTLTTAINRQTAHIAKLTAATESLRDTIRHAPPAPLSHRPWTDNRPGLDFRPRSDNWYHQTRPRTDSRHNDSGKENGRKEENRGQKRERESEKENERDEKKKVKSVVKK